MVAGESVLRRKAAARVTRKTTAPGPERAMRLAFLRTTQAIRGLDAVVEGVEERRMSLSELLDDLPTPSLFALLSGPGEALGLAVVPCPALATIVEARMTGRLLGAEPGTRRPTPTDAALVSEFIDGLLREVEGMPAESDLRPFSGFRYGSYLEDPRPLDLTLEEGVYCTFRISVGFSLGARRTVIILAVPAGERALFADPGGTAPKALTEDWAMSLERQVAEAPLRFDAVLGRVTLPLSAVLSLAPGVSVPLDGATLEKVGLIGLDGREIATGRLGQAQGRRALRLAVAPGPVTEG